MKNSILLIISIAICSFSFAQKNECDKFFFKEKKSSKKSSTFSNKTIKTKYGTFFSNGKRTVSISFIEDETGLKLQFFSAILESGGVGIKKEVILGQNIKIALHFEDGTTEIIQFKSSEQEGQFQSGGNSSNQNEIVLTDELLNKFMTIKVISSEFQNPFNVVNGSPVKSREVKQKIQVKIMKMATCFKNRINKV